MSGVSPVLSGLTWKAAYFAYPTQKAAPETYPFHLRLCRSFRAAKVSGQSQMFLSGPLRLRVYVTLGERVRKASGVGDLRIHDLRHGFGTRAAGLGANALVLRDALGHHTLAMTNRYVSRQTDPVRDIVNRIGMHVEAVVNGW